jgi:hypothetical protein
LLSPTTIACWVVFMKLEGSAKFEPVILPTTSTVLRHPLHEQLVQKVQLVKNGFHVCSEKGRIVLESIDEHIIYIYARVFWCRRSASLGGTEPEYRPFRDLRSVPEASRPRNMSKITEGPVLRSFPT